MTAPAVPQGMGAFCRRLKSAYPGTELVFGEGNTASGVMAIGEAPGREEVEQGRPFVGKAGRNLTAFLEAAGLSRGDLYLTNVCKFRPVRIGPKNTTANRTPSRGEILAAVPFLQEEIKKIAPKVLITLGNTPLHAVAGFGAGVGNLHGKPCRVQAGGKERWLFALYHPASILYNPSLKAAYEKDMSILAAWLPGILG